MRKPLILVTSSTAESGAEFPDPSVSVACDYIDALTESGAVPVCLPVLLDPSVITAAVTWSDGILMTGGGDIEPRLYGFDASADLRATCEWASPGRDASELMVIQEAFRQGKPLLAICRGHQLVNVALGGTLWVHLPSQCPSPVLHRDYERRFEPIHSVSPVGGTQLSQLIGPEPLGVNSTHHQAICQLAAPLQASAIAPDGLIEATEFSPIERAQRAWFLSVQFHPERLRRRDPRHILIFADFVQACQLPLK